MALSLADPLQLQAEGDVVPHVQPWHQGVLLEDDGSVGAGAADLAAIQKDLAARSATRKPAIRLSNVDFPQPEAPSATTKSLSSMRQVDPLQRRDRRTAVLAPERPPRRPSDLQSHGHPPIRWRAPGPDRPGPGNTASVPIGRPPSRNRHSRRRCSRPRPCRSGPPDFRKSAVPLIVFGRACPASVGDLHPTAAGT